MRAEPESSNSSDSESVDSDAEVIVIDCIQFNLNNSRHFLQLQEAFEKGALKPGLNVQEPAQRKFANNIVCFIKHEKKIHF